MGPFNYSRHLRISDRPQRRHRLHRGEGQVISSRRLCPRPRAFRDLPSQLSGADRLSAILSKEELAGYLRPYLGPICSWQRRADGQPGCGIDRRHAFRHFEAERADLAIENLERRPEFGRASVVDIADTDVRMITRRLAPGLAGYLVVIVVSLLFAGAGRLRGTKIASFDSPLVKIATAWW
jgi:hypothetical protein